MLHSLYYNHDEGDTEADAAIAAIESLAVTGDQKDVEKASTADTA